METIGTKCAGNHFERQLTAVSRFQAGKHDGKQFKFANLTFLRAKKIFYFEMLKYKTIGFIPLVFD